MVMIITVVHCSALLKEEKCLLNILNYQNILNIQERCLLSIQFISRFINNLIQGLSEYSHSQKCSMILKYFLCSRIQNS